MIKIGLEQISTFAYHGVLAAEKENGNTFFTDVNIWYKKEQSMQTDCIEDTFNYQLIYNVVADEMKISSNLLEHVAARIIQSLAAKESLIKKISVKISKANPPINGKAKFSTVTIKKKVNR